MVAVVDRARFPRPCAASCTIRDFQAIESAWRGLQFFLRRLETDENLKVYLLDVTKAELASDLTAHEDLRDTALYKNWRRPPVKSVDRRPGPCLPGCTPFPPLKWMRLCWPNWVPWDRCSAHRLSPVRIPFVGCPSFFHGPDPARTGSSTTLRRTITPGPCCEHCRKPPGSGWAAPISSSGCPTGEDTIRLMHSDLKRCATPMAHEDYLWANPVYALVLVLGCTFTKNGWDGFRVSPTRRGRVAPSSVFTDGAKRPSSPAPKRF
jgi:hypothetical protein